MSTDALKLSLLTYIKHFGLYDYLAFGWLFITFLVLIILAGLIARRSSIASLLLVIFALLLLSIAPFFIKTKLSEIVRTTTTEVTMVKKLTFSSSLIVEGNISNHSAKDFKLCLVHTSIFKKTDARGFKAYLNSLKPITNQSILVTQDLAKEDTMEYQAVFDGFDYSGDVFATLKAECY